MKIFQDLLAAAKGVKHPNCRLKKAIAAVEKELANPIREKVIELARENDGSDELEIDDDAILSEGWDNGCFVSAWLWVEFDGTELDKEKDQEAA